MEVTMDQLIDRDTEPTGKRRGADGDREKEGGRRVGEGGEEVGTGHTVSKCWELWQMERRERDRERNRPKRWREVEAESTLVQELGKNKQRDTERLLSTETLFLLTANQVMREKKRHIHEEKASGRALWEYMMKDTAKRDRVSHLLSCWVNSTRVNLFCLRLSFLILFFA